jgi:hypothetical protein
VHSSGFALAFRLLPKVNVGDTKRTGIGKHAASQHSRRISIALSCGKHEGRMKDEEDSGVRETIVMRAAQMARSGEFARCIDIEAALIPQFGYQALRNDFRSPAFQNNIERICREAFKGQSNN